MPITNITWDSIYQKGRQPSLAIARRAMQLLRDTSITGATSYFPSSHFDESTLIAKIGYENAGVNFMKMTTGRDDSSGNFVDIVILYQWFKHRSMWGTTIAFDQTAVLVPAPDPNVVYPTPTDNPYLKLSTAIATRMWTDLKDISPSGSTSVMYDDFHATDFMEASKIRRRRTKIGELGFVSETNPEVLNRFNVAKTIEDFPVTATGIRIPARHVTNGANKIVTTLFTWKSA